MFAWTIALLLSLFTDNANQDNPRKRKRTTTQNDYSQKDIDAAWDFFAEYKKLPNNQKLAALRKYAEESKVNFSTSQQNWLRRFNQNKAKPKPSILGRKKLEEIKKDIADGKRTAEKDEIVQELVECGYKLQTAKQYTNVMIRVNRAAKKRKVVSPPESTPPKAKVFSRSASTVLWLWPMLIGWILLITLGLKKLEAMRSQLMLMEPPSTHTKVREEDLLSKLARQLCPRQLPVAGQSGPSSAVAKPFAPGIRLAW